MLDWIRPRLLKFLRVPHDPTPPAGAPGSVRVFRAGARFFHVRLAAWLFAQIGAAIGLAVSIFFISEMREVYDRTHAAPPPAPVAKAAPAPATENPAPDAATETPDAVNPTAPEAGAPKAEAAPATDGKKSKLPRDMRTKRNRERAQRAFFERVPAWTITAVQLAELAGIAFFLAQLPVTFAAVRLDWEYRWYIVTDRSLRIRAGLWSLQESTMSFANLQQVEVRQGPVQRLLGIADVRVQSAGGGGGGEHGGQAGDSLHTGVFHGVENAHEIRDLILARLKQFRAAGLGDPEDHHAETAAAPAAATPEPPTAALAAARDLLEEARALRKTLS